MKVLRKIWHRLKHAWAYFKWAYFNEYSGEYDTIIRLLIFKLEREIEYYKSSDFITTENKKEIIEQIQLAVDKLKAVAQIDFFYLYIEKRAIKKLGFSLEIERYEYHENFEIIYKDPKGNDPKYSQAVKSFYHNAIEFENKISKRFMREALRQINKHIWNWWD